MGYSRIRLTGLAVAWLVAAAATFALFGGFGAIGGGGGCDITKAGNPPCAFPAENYDGGIIMGGTQMAVETTEGNGPCSGWGDAGASGSANALDYYADQFVPLSYDQSNSERVAYVGTKAIQDCRDSSNPPGSYARNLFIYKSWRYDDPETDRRENVYLWMNATKAEADFVACQNGCAYGGVADRDCRGDNGLDCALRVEVSEVSAEKFAGHGQTFIGSANLSVPDYWIVEPSEDTCGLLSFTLCMQLGGSEGDFAYAGDFMFRIHGATMERFNDENKVMLMRNMTMEFRYGRGTDRAILVDGAHHSDFSDPADGSGLGNGFDCQGNVEGDGTGTPCIVDQDDKAPPPMRPYEAYQDRYG